ncbi:MAG: YggT family protein [Candidatus Neomarinimicrobiota bacterium]
MGHLLIILGRIVSLAISILEVLIIVQVVLSWLGVRLPLNQLTRLFYALTDAVYRPVRAVIPTLFGGLDISPLIALAGLYAIDRWLVSAIIRMGYRLAG